MTTKISLDNIQDSALEQLSGSGGGVTAYATIAELPLAGNDSGSMAFVEQNNRLYIWNGVGWFNIALINTNPTISQGPNPSYAFATDGAPIVITLVAEDPEGIPIVFSAQVTSGTLGNTAVITQDANVFTITPSTNEDDVGVFSVTFTASDGVNIATAVSSFTLRFTAADAYYNQSILLTTSTFDNADNNTFVDSSTNNFAITRTGNTTQGTFGPYSPAGWSGYFDGAGDELTIANNAAFNLGTGDFTAECWFNISANSTANADGNRSGFLFGPGQLVNAAAWMLEISGNSTTTGAGLVFQSRNSSGTPTTLSYSFTFAKNTWYHAAASKVGNTLALFVNGQKVAENTNWTVLTDSGGSLFRIGRRAISANYEHYFNGYISNIRVIKGIGLYTANFTPSTEPLTATAGTSLLTLQDNRFVDRSTNNFAITRVGDTRITAFSPFLPTEQYDPATHGGSAYFDGTGDFLSTTGGAGLSLDADFTIDFWMNPSSLALSGIISNNNTSFNTNAAAFIVSHSTASNKISFWVQNIVDELLVASTTTLTVGQWFHIALSRQSGTLRLFVNGTLEATRLSSTGTINLISNGSLNVGRYWGGSFTGYISNLRVVKGTAVYTTNFTPPTAPLEPVADTSLLLNFTNAAIFDETGKVVLETVGDARTSTAVVKYGDTSMAFDGTGDYLLVPSDPVFDFPGDFTIEMWLNLANLSSTWQSIISRAYALTGGWRLYKTESINQLRWYVGTASIVGTTGSTMVNNTWSHVAVVRSGSTVTIYIDGVNRGSATNTTNLSPGNYAIEIGQGVVTSAFPMTGHISDLRITNGHARYTATFTPPTQKLGYTNPE